MSQGGDDDVEALLAQFALEEKAKSSADIREDVPPPSARVYASFTAHPTSVSFKDSLTLACSTPNANVTNEKLV